MEITIEPYPNGVSAHCKWKNRRCQVTYLYEDNDFYLEVKAYAPPNPVFGGYKIKRGIGTSTMRLSAETFTILTQCQLALVEYLANRKK